MADLAKKFIKIFAPSLSKDDYRYGPLYKFVKAIVTKQYQASFDDITIQVTGDEHFKRAAVLIEKLQAELEALEKLESEMIRRVEPTFHEAKDSYWYDSKSYSTAKKVRKKFVRLQDEFEQFYFFVHRSYELNHSLGRVIGKESPKYMAPAVVIYLIMPPIIAESGMGYKSKKSIKSDLIEWIWGQSELYLNDGEELVPETRYNSWKGSLLGRASTLRKHLGVDTELEDTPYSFLHQMTCSPKTDPHASRVCYHCFKEQTHEETLYRRTDYCRAEGIRGRREDWRFMSPARDFPGDVLQLARKVWRHGGL